MIKSNRKEKYIENIKSNRFLSYVEMYFLNLLKDEQKEEYIKYIKNWLKNEQEYTQSHSEYVHAKLKFMYELVLEYEKRTINKPISFWLKKLYFGIGRIDDYFKEKPEFINPLIENYINK